MAGTVVFAPEAKVQLIELSRYVGKAASRAVAAKFTGAIVIYCESLQLFPHRGARRDDIRPGLRITSYRRRVSIAYQVDDLGKVLILGVFYAGLDFRKILREDAPD